MMNKILCDDCGYIVTSLEPLIQMQEIDKGVTEKFFCCPKCGKRYTIVITDQIMCEQMAKRQALQRQYQTAVNDRAISAQLKAIRKKADKLKHKLIRRASMLERKYRTQGGI